MASSSSEDWLEQPCGLQVTAERFRALGAGGDAVGASSGLFSQFTRALALFLMDKGSSLLTSVGCSKSAPGFT